MNLSRCLMGHFYDKDKYASCPYCNPSCTKFYEKEILNKFIWNYIQSIKDKLFKIEHENIVKVFDLYTSKNKNYIKEEFIYGNIIEKMIADYQISLNDFLNIGIGICEALKYLNEHNMTYMDLKPSNIIYQKDNEKAILIDIESIYCYRITSGIKYFGTIEYSAPEQILYSKYSIKGAIYSLGLILYKILSGSLPFNVSKSGIINKINNELVFDFENCYEFRQKTEIINLIEKMVCVDENDRLEIENVISMLHKIKKDASKEELQQSITLKDKNYLIDDSTFSAFQDDSTCGFFNDSFVETINPFSEVTNQKENVKDLTYRTELLKEYNSILFQTKVLFWCWIFSVSMCYIIVAICIYFILNEKFLDSAFSVLLEGLVYAVQKIFSIREDHYRELINKKLSHLQKGDFVEYALSKIEYINDINEKDKKIAELIDDLRKNSS
ncbi:MAG: protein kinase [Lachnospiraceae bacterium]|nr:protein kinase [Lachnospiraceae bacterium]